jgi:hypothetical protein
MVAVGKDGVGVEVGAGKEGEAVCEGVDTSEAVGEGASGPD